MKEKNLASAEEEVRRLELFLLLTNVRRVGAKAALQKQEKSDSVRLMQRGSGGVHIVSIVGPSIVEISPIFLRES